MACAWASEAFAALHLGLGVDGGAAGLAAVLALGLDRLAELALLAGGGGLGGLARGLQVVALDHGDQLAGLHVLAFVDGQGLDAAGNLGAHHHLVGVHRADQLQIAGGPHGDEVPDQRSDGQQAQDQKNSIACVHLCLTSSAVLQFDVAVSESIVADSACSRHGRGWPAPARPRARHARGR